MNQPCLFGDWLSVDCTTANEVLQTAFYAYSCQMVRDAARALGDDDEAEARQQSSTPFAPTSAASSSMIAALSLAAPNQPDPDRTGFGPPL